MNIPPQIDATQYQTRGERVGEDRTAACFTGGGERGGGGSGNSSKLRLTIGLAEMVVVTVCGGALTTRSRSFSGREAMSTIERFLAGTAVFGFSWGVTGGGDTFGAAGSAETEGSNPDLVSFTGSVLQPATQSTTTGNKAAYILTESLLAGHRTHVTVPDGRLLARESG